MVPSSIMFTDDTSPFGASFTVIELFSVITFTIVVDIIPHVIYYTSINSISRNLKDIPARCIDTYVW